MLPPARYRCILVVFIGKKHVCVFLENWMDDLAEPAMAPSPLIHTLGVTTLHHTIGKGLARVQHTARRRRIK